MQDHVTHLEILREEIDLVTNRKNDLEKKVHQLITERESLSTALDESADKILMLEKHTREQDCQVRAVQTRDVVTFLSVEGPNKWAHGQMWGFNRTFTTH